MPAKTAKITKTLISPEVLVPRLGEQLIKMQLITEAQLNKALEYQRLRAAQGNPALLGEAVVKLGFLDRPTLDNAITEHIIRLRTALEDANRHLEYRVKQRTAELEEALRKLSEINQLKANFIANVSHELRTPLTLIRGYLELLCTEALGELNNDQKKALDVSMRSSVRLQNLINDLLLFSLAARGEMTLALKPVDLNRVISAVLTQAAPKAHDNKLDLNVDIDPDLPFVQADEEKLNWVLLQLLDNATKFTQPGGKIQFAAKLEDDKMVNITVTDTGIGIAPERMKEIFEPFHQLDGSATSRFGGTGLGLALVRQIVEAHGSLITVHSELNKGTTITFPLLVARNEGEAA